MTRARRAHLRRILTGILTIVATRSGIANAQSAPLPKTRADSLKADSARVADSLAIIRELEQQSPPAPGRTPVTQAGPSNARLLPDVSVVGDLIADLSRKGSTQEDGSRFGIREIELAVGAAVDPFFRGDVFLGFSDAEGVAVEQAFLTATALPWGLEVRLGRQLMPVGKQNTTHRHDLHSIEYPLVVQQLLSPEGLNGTGVYASRIFSPLHFYQEVIVTVVDRFGDAPADLLSEAPPNKRLSGLGYSARLRNYWDLSPSTNLEISVSAITGLREQPITGAGATNAINARQTVYGMDVTLRWRPLRQGLYKSFILQAEALHQGNERNPAMPLGTGGVTPTYAGPRRDFSGWYAFSRWQTGRRSYLGARVDGVQDAAFDGQSTFAASAYWEFFPSEFSKLVAGYERVTRPTDTGTLHRMILQAAFALGPHRPHPF